MSRIRKRKQIIEAKAVLVNKKKEIELFPKQKDFIFRPERYTAFSGGFGAAKTFAGCIKGILLSAIFPGNKGLVSRETYPELRDATRKTFLDLVPLSWILDWNKTENILVLRNGSQIIFRPLDEVKKHRSSEYGWFFIDQAEETEESDFLDLIGRLRHPVPRQYGFIASNPDGHNWIWKRFFDKPEKDFYGINTTTFDNPTLDPSYLKSMLDNYPKEWCDKFIYGSHEVKSGVILSEYSDDLIVDPFIIPSGWIKGRGMDWGVDKPCTRVSVALSDDGVFYVFDCYAKAGDTPEEHAAAILQRDKGIAYQVTKMDSTAWRREGTSKDSSKLSVAMQFIKAGLKMTPATRDFTGSLLILKSLMKQGKIKFFRGQCDGLIEEIKSWKWGRPVAGKETPAVGEDHYCDSLRYIVYALAGRHTESIGVERKTEETPTVRSKIINITKGSINPVSYDPVTGFPTGF